MISKFEWCWWDLIQITSVWVEKVLGRMVAGRRWSSWTPRCCGEPVNILSSMEYNWSSQANVAGLLQPANRAESFQSRGLPRKYDSRRKPIGLECFFYNCCHYYCLHWSDLVDRPESPYFMTCPVEPKNKWYSSPLSLMFNVSYFVVLWFPEGKG